MRNRCLLMSWRTLMLSQSPKTNNNKSNYNNNSSNNNNKDRLLRQKWHQASEQRWATVGVNSNFKIRVYWCREMAHRTSLPMQLMGQSSRSWCSICSSSPATTSSKSSTLSQARVRKHTTKARTPSRLSQLLGRWSPHRELTETISNRFSLIISRSLPHWGKTWHRRQLKQPIQWGSQTSCLRRKDSYNLK
jgi:hypothetical protein